MRHNHAGWRQESRPFRPPGLQTREMHKTKGTLWSPKVGNFHLAITGPDETLRSVASRAGITPRELYQRLVTEVGAREIEPGGGSDGWGAAARPASAAPGTGSGWGRRTVREVAWSWASPPKWCSNGCADVGCRHVPMNHCGRLPCATSCNRPSWRKSFGAENDGSVPEEAARRSIPIRRGCICRGARLQSSPVRVSPGKEQPCGDRL